MKFYLKSLVLKAKDTHISLWVIIFFILNIISRGNGGTNTLSRFATMRAMTEQTTFKIDNYKNWTFDWAQTPDGHYYSNKAPGPMFLGLPFFFLLDQFSKFDRKDVISGKGIRIRPVGPTPQMILSIIMQVIPFLIVLVIIISWMKDIGISFEAQQFTALSMLFGNTVSVYMNSYFGHGMCAILLLLSMWFFYKRKYFFVGLFYGLALLSDYASGFLLIPLLGLLLWENKKDIKWILPFIAGGVVPGILWVWYHYICFGSPFAIPGQFQSPMWQDVKTEGANLWGIFHYNLPPRIFYELLLGPKRGLLITQPWMLVFLLLGLFFSKGKTRKFTIFSVIGFLFLLLMNVSFGGWHGGWTVGPRYLSIIFLVISLSCGLSFDRFPSFLKKIMWATLCISIVYHGLVYSTSRLIPEIYNVWPWMIEKIFSFEDKRHIAKFIVFIILMSFGYYRTFKRSSGDRLKESA